MKIIRGELTDAAVTPPSTRYDATCNCIQVTSDGGSTWVEAVGQDPRSQPAYLKPPVAGSNKRCDAAANMTAWIKGIVDGLIAALTAGATDLLMANGILQVIEQIFPFAAYFINLMFQLAVDVLAVGAADLNTAFSSTTYDTLTCIFYCHLDGDGRVTPDTFALIGGDVVAQLNTTAALIVGEIMFITGYVGLSNAGAIGSETGDCTGCECGWCYHFDGTNTLGDWVATQWNGVCDTLPVYSGGVWDSGLVTCGHTVSYVHLRWVLSSSVAITDAAAHATSGIPNRSIWINGDGTLFSGTEIWNGTWLAGAGATATSIDILFFQAIDDGTPFTLDWAQFSGISGTPPFGDPNC